MSHAPTPALAPIQVASPILGEITVQPHEVLTFPKGLAGLPECTRYVLLGTAQEHLFWLQSLDHPSLVLVLADPFHFVPSYVVDLGPSDRADLRVSSRSDTLVLSIVTLPDGEGTPATINLQGPLAIHLKERLGKQVILTSTSHAVRQPVDLYLVHVG